MRWNVIMALIVGTCTIHAAPERLVCLGGSVTETVFALGSGSLVAGVDDSSTRPPEAADRPSIGYYRMASAEGILSLNPDAVLASEDAGPPHVMEQLKGTGTPVITVTGGHTIPDALTRIHAIAQYLGKEREGINLATELEQGMKAIPPVDGDPVDVLFVFARGAGTLNVSGTGTAADEIIRLAGGRNAVTGYEGYRPLTAEAMVTAAPDVILLTDSGLGSIGGPEGLASIPGISMTPAGRDNRIVSLDDLYLLGFGPRVHEAVLDLHRKLYP